MVAAVVMLVVGFFFATVSGNLVGMIGSSNNPISGLTLSTLIIAALADGGAWGGRAFPAWDGPGSGGGGVRFLGRRGRVVAGFQGRLHPGRHAQQDSDGGTGRGGGRQHGDVFAALRCYATQTEDGFGSRLCRRRKRA